MDWRAKVELFEQIRREYEFGAGTIIGIARKLGVHRRMVREAVRSATPTRRKKTERPRVKMAAVSEFIDGILEADRKAPRKQRHTAKRIWERTREEVAGSTVAERTIRQYVERRKQELGYGGKDTFVPQSYEWGVEAQVDWYEAFAELDGERTKLQVFSMRSMASGAAYHRAYLRATQQAFLEAHELAFHYFGGVFHRLRYDNLSSAVKKILRGYERELTARFIAFRSHWRYTAEFCTPGEGHEKGGVEGEVGYFRRNHWVPVPRALDLAGLNAQLLASCHRDESRILAGRSQSVGALLLMEKEHLLPLAGEDFELAEVSFPRVDQAGCAKVLANSYSVPLKPGSIVEARAYSSLVEFRHDGERIGAAPTELWPGTAGAGSGTLSGSAGTQARRVARVPSRWRSGELRDDGRPVTTGCGSRCVCDMAARAQRGPWLQWFAWVASLAMRSWRILSARRWSWARPISLPSVIC